MTDDNRGNAVGPYWNHCGAGLHMGRMDPKPLAGEFGAVLTVALKPGQIDPLIPHRHIPISYVKADVDRLVEAIEWVHTQFSADRTVLVRSEGGRQRPGLIIASVFVRLGADDFEAMRAVRRHDHLALTDFRYTALVRQLYAVMSE